MEQRPALASSGHEPPSASRAARSRSTHGKGGEEGGRGGAVLGAGELLDEPPAVGRTEGEGADAETEGAAEGVAEGVAEGAA